MDSGAEDIRAHYDVPLWAQVAGYTARRHVEGLRDLQQEARVREQPEPLDGRHQAALQPEPAAHPHPSERLAHPGIRLHPLPEERPRAESGLAALAAHSP